MSQRKKKPVQYFFVDINDPDYYKRIKVARACIDCRKRKSKCDIGVPGSGPCSGCRKHNKVCEFTTSTIVSPTPPSSVSSSGPRAQVAQSEIKKRKNQLYQRRHQRHHQRHHIYPSSQIDVNFDQSQYNSTFSLAMVPENFYNNTSLYATCGNGSVGVGINPTTPMHVDLPVFCLEKSECPSLPTTPPLSLSSPSMLSSTTTTPSPPLHTDDAYGTTFPWKSSDPSCPDMEISMHSVALVDPPKIDFSTPTPSSMPNMLECQLFEIYLQHIHPLYPVISASTLSHPANTLPLCLRHAILALSLLYYQPQTSSAIHMAYDYYTKSSKALQLCEVNGIAVVQTLLILYKYHETMGEKSHEYFLESAQANLEKLAAAPGDDDDDEKQEWICRLQWIVFLHQFGGSSTLDSSWRDPPIIRSPCLLPSEQHDTNQMEAISKLLDAIHIANVYSSAMQSLCISVEDPWAQVAPSL